MCDRYVSNRIQSEDLERFSLATDMASLCGNNPHRYMNKLFVVQCVPWTILVVIRSMDPFHCINRSATNSLCV